MRIMPSMLLVLLITFLAGSLPAGEKDKPTFTPPRLRISTVTDKGANAIRVDAVAPGGLGDQLGLKAKDVIKSVSVVDMDRSPMDVKAPSDLARWLDKVGSATKNKEQACTITLSVLTDKGSKEVKGKVYRLNAADSKDGGTLYFFKKLDAK
jgi:hypothetical protein